MLEYVLAEHLGLRFDHEYQDAAAMRETNGPSSAHRSKYRRGEVDDGVDAGKLLECKDEAADNHRLGGDQLEESRLLWRSCAAGCTGPACMSKETRLSLLLRSDVSVSRKRTSILNESV